MRVGRACHREMKIGRRNKGVRITAAPHDDAAIFTPRHRLADPPEVVAVLERRRLRLAGSKLDRMNNIVVTGTAAVVARNGLANVVIVQLSAGIVLEQRVRAHQHTGGAITTLKGVTSDECFLQLAQARAIGQTFDGGNFCAVGAGRQNQTGFHHFTV